MSPSLGEIVASETMFADWRTEHERASTGLVNWSFVFIFFLLFFPSRFVCLNTFFPSFFLHLFVFISFCLQFNLKGLKLLLNASSYDVFHSTVLVCLKKAHECQIFITVPRWWWVEDHKVMTCLNCSSLHTFLMNYILSLGMLSPTQSLQTFTDKAKQLKKK